MLPPPPPPPASGAHAPSTFPSLAADLDIVIPTIRDLDFLADWRDFLQPYHLIIIQDGDPAAPRVRVPPGYDADVYTRADVERVLGSRAACISYKDSACRCFGFLVSKKRYIFTVDDDCFVAVDPDGARVNALASHIRNLLTPSTPHFFNTLYDPFREGADYVRGYPFSLRSGVPTAVSHGLWLGVPDYDAPTALAKPNERNTRYVDAVLTVPSRTLYPMCGMNLAFDRASIGPAMYFGLMGEGAPWGRYDDMWAGWCSKVICDHLDIGVKTGTPYIRHARASNALTNLRKEYNGIFWQEACVEFFRKVELPSSAKDAVSCYLALADRVRAELTAVDPYFGRLADAMVTWIEAWRQLNPEWPHVGSARSADDATRAAAPTDADASACDTAVADAGVTLTVRRSGVAKPADDGALTSPAAARRAKRGRLAP